MRPAFDALFDPRGVLVAGASTHPGKFGFVALHNILASGYAGRVFATNLEGGEILGVPVATSVDDLPDGAIDLAFVCTPPAANVELLEACARKGVRAAFVTTAGYGEAGPDGKDREKELVATAERLGILLAGPNGQGVVSTPSSLCAQIVAPFPPRGAIGLASQSGNFVSSFQNYAVQTGIGISRAVSAGNAAAVGVVDYLAYYADDPETAVGLAYVEGIGGDDLAPGAALFRRLREITERMPLVVLKGGATAGGQRAAASHTGSLAADDRVFDGACRQAGVTRAATVEEAFEAAATFATQPLPRGPRVAVVTTAGGWGVVTADAITRSELELVASHPDVDAVVYLGLGIQSNQARMMREGPFHPDHGLERIVAYHERQDARFARAAADVSQATGKPVLTATELAVASPDNPGPRTVRETNRLCYAASNRAVTALEHLWRHARWRLRRDLT